MSCNSCAKPFTLLRKEKGCPNCGFSFCSKCLDGKIFITKLNAEAKVCAKCKNSDKQSKESVKIEPPDAYYKRLGQIKKSDKPSTTSKHPSSSATQNMKDQEILDRLRKLKEDSKHATTGTTEREIAERLQKIKGEVPKTSDEELQERLAKLRGVPVSVIRSPPVLPPPDTRSEQEQANNLLAQYMDETKVDGRYKDEFDALVGDIETRLSSLKGAEGSSSKDRSKPPESSEKVRVSSSSDSSEDEEETVRKIVAKVKADASLDPDVMPSTNDELPFCEICNEDANMRCLGCRYLFCKRCFLEHKDDDDGCDRYEPYTPPKNCTY